jgi:MoaA/NifB/PqqE/SkfB family radical SAM enzyme
VISSLYLMPTLDCNCECGYCYIGKSSGEPVPGLLTRVSGSWMDWLRSMGSNAPSRPQIRFTGGEPWLEAETVSGVSRTFLDGFPGGRVVVNTNGTVMDGTILSGFSGDSSRRRLRGGGSSWDGAVSGIRLLRERSLPVCINTVLDSRTAEELPVLLDVVSGMGMGGVSLSLVFSPGSKPDPAERFGLLRRAYRAAADRGVRLGGHHRLLLGHRIPGLECTAGRSTMLVDPAGGMHACQRFVGRFEPECTWTGDFDWNGFESSAGRSCPCLSKGDLEVGDMLYGMYREEFPDYLHRNELDEFLFGVLP